MCPQKLYHPNQQVRDKLTADDLRLSLEADQNNSYLWRAGEYMRVPVRVHTGANEIIVPRPPYPVVFAYHWKREDGLFDVFGGEGT